MEETTNIFKRKYKYAADYGFILGGYIAVFFVLDFLFQNNALVGILQTLGLFGTPIVCYYISRQYRDKAWGGYIRFGQVWSFGIMLFFFASLLMSVLYFIYSKYINTDFLTIRYNESIYLIEKMKGLTKYENYRKELLDAYIARGVQTPIQYVFDQLWTYISGGAILFLAISPMIARKNPEDTNQNSGTVKTYEPYEENKDKNDSDKSKSE